MTGHDTFDVDVAAYALDALPKGERQAFEAHLATCAECRRTLAELRRVSAGLGLSTEPIDPPSSLRARTLARATAQRQDPVASRGPLPMRPVGASAMRRSTPRSSWLALAASLACVAALGSYAWGLRAQLITTRQLLADMSTRAETLRTQLAAARQDSATLVNTVNVLRSGNVIRVDLRGQSPTPAATGRAFVSNGNGLVFSTEHLPRLGANRTYQLWVFTPGVDHPISAGTFDLDPSGTSMLAIPLPQAVGLVAALAVTDEPSGGSPGPTTNVLLLGKSTN